MTSLTRDEARERRALIAVESYSISLDLTGSDRHFAAVTTIRFAATTEGATTFVDVAPHEVHSAVLNGVSLDVGAAFDPTTRRLRLAGLAPRNELVVDASMAYSHDGEGLHRHVDPADGRTYLYAMSFLDAAPRWFACFDQPDLKARVRVDVHCPPEWRVAGNGPASQVSPGHWQIATTGPLATYFTTIVAGPYHEIRDLHDGIPLVLLVRQSLAQHLDRDAGELFAHTRHCLDRLHTLFGVRYPWGEYHQAFVPEFNAGAMENPGCVTFRDDLIFRSRATDAERTERAITIAHEMAHMWFGDLVTMRWWDDLWLNESFAEYLGHRVTGEHTWTAFGIDRKSWGYAADRRPSTHPVAGNGAVDAGAALTDFDGISYAKGASVLRQLAVHLGDDVFLDGLHRYITAHANGNAEFADLLNAWTACGAVDLGSWTQSWLRTSGLDDLVVDGGVLYRRGHDDADRTHAIEVAGFDADGTERWRTRVRVGDAAAPLGRDADLVIPDASDETWAKVVLPAAAWELMPRTLFGIDESRTRVVVWNALQLAVADAEVDPALAMDIVTTALPPEPDDAVLAVVGQWAQREVCAMYLDGGARADALAGLSEALRAVTYGSRAGSARQLAAARLVIGTSTDAPLMQGWLEGTGVPPGLVIDADLRWTVVTRLALLGALDEAGIDAEQRQDRSSQGAVHAARARAVRPDPAAKQVAWQAIMTDAQRPNYELYAIAQGFWQPGQDELTAPYVERYFAEIGATAALRSGWVVDRLAELAYPRTAVTRVTLDATAALLEHPDLNVGIRRSVVDAGDDLRRAVAVRERFAH